LGALMNTRGLIELIVLNLGYDLGILPPKIFAMMVLMALTTTFMTGPLLSLSEFVAASARSSSYETKSWGNRLGVEGE
jgi:Kef-type K+ transport system membrane component KefB